MSGFPYRVDDEAQYLDRQERMRAATHGLHLDPAELSGILSEVGPLPWVVGRWYRVRLIAGKPQNRHLHGFDEAGTEYAIDMPQIPVVEWLDLDVRPVGRTPSTPGQRHIPAMLFELRDGQLAMFHEIDVFTAEVAA